MSSSAGVRYLRDRSGRRLLPTALSLIVLSVVGALGPSAAEPLARIPFEIQANRIVFPMKVGDSPEMKILLDTGLTLYGRSAR